MISHLQSFPFILNQVRNGYQACEALHFFFSANAAPLEKFDVNNKIAIAVLDAWSSHLHYFYLSNSNPNLKNLLNITEAGCRLIDICRGVYLLGRPQVVDRDYIQQTMVLNLLNIYRIALNSIRRDMLNPPQMLQYASLACSSLDVAIRVYSIFSHRIAIRNQIDQFYQNIDFARIGSGLDYVGRGIGHTVCIIKSCVMGAFFIQTTSNQLPSKVAALVPLTLGMTAVTKITVNKLFDGIAIQQNPTRDLAEWTIAIASSVIFGAATAVGMGLASSISEVFRQIVPGILIVGLLSTLTVTIAIGVKQIFNDMGFQRGGVLLDLAIYSFAAFSAIYLTPLASVGFGLTQSTTQVGDLFMRTIGGGLSFYSFYSMFERANSLIVNGPMRWETMFDELAKPC